MSASLVGSEMCIETALRAHSGPRVFAQTNDAVAEALAGRVAEILTGEEKLLIDVFCGAGFFSKRLALQFERVVGIDWDRFAIEAAQEDAGANEAYVAGDVTTELRWLLQQSDLTSTALIVDPPATGLSAETRRAILDAPPATMIYVSCNPPTLARDIAESQQRFAVISITPFDMFPQTAEIEVVVHLKSTDMLRQNFARAQGSVLEGHESVFGSRSDPDRGKGQFV
jgi:tRNA/tmRNA/rRNA uracil-C5-methylase (TrmA/RlmC/RlmD family)